jgi:hypothetical protein
MFCTKYLQVIFFNQRHYADKHDVMVYLVGLIATLNEEVDEGY